MFKCFLNSKIRQLILILFQFLEFHNRFIYKYILFLTKDVQRSLFGGWTFTEKRSQHFIDMLFLIVLHSYKSTYQLFVVYFLFRYEFPISQFIIEIL